MRVLRSPLLLLMFYVAAACATRTPFDAVKQQYAEYPEYSIILEDMREEGNFFKDYFHRYKIVYGRAQAGSDSLVFDTVTSDWVEVEKRDYEKYYNNLGMVVASKSANGEIANQAYPPGYQYVGDPRYGEWRRDDRGHSFWEFYGKYALLSQVFGMFGRPVYRSDWDSYRDYRRRGSPYFGRNSEYGTNGSRTRTSNPGFYERQRQKQQARQTRFSEKVKNRVKRSKMSGVRSRSRGFGK